VDRRGKVALDASYYLLFSPFLPASHTPVHTLLLSVGRAFSLPTGGRKARAKRRIRTGFLLNAWPTKLVYCVPLLGLTPHRRKEQVRGEFRGLHRRPAFARPDRRTAIQHFTCTSHCNRLLSERFSSGLETDKPF